MLDNTTQRNERVVGWTVDGCNGVGIGFGKVGKKMEIAGGQGGSRIHHAMDRGAILIT